MSNTSPIHPWLDHLVDLLPPTTIRLVGAGNGSGIWVQWLAAHSQIATTLVEANPQQFAALQRQQALGNLAQATLVNTVIAPSTGDVDFFTASLTSESGLLPSEELRALWPNVHTVATHTQPAMDLAALLQLGAEQSIGPQWLLLDCLPAAALLRSAQAQLPQVDVVVARVLLCATDNAPTLCGMGAGLKDVADALPGFQLLALQPSRHPALGHALFVRDYRRAAQHASQARDAEAQAKQAAQQAQASLQAQLLQAHADNAELLKKQELQAQAQQALQADLTKTIQARDAEAQAQQAAQQAQADLQAQLVVQLKNQSDELIRVRKFLDSTVQREVANATKQIEAAIGLQNYFATGELPHINTERHSWPISPDFALYLIELLELNDYDLIVEFGSGISTSIIAKTLAKMAAKRSGKPPVDFVSFDHLEKYYQQTLAQLEHAGLAEAVQLNLAPLQDWLAPNGNTYPYYACQPTLAALAKKHPAAGLRLLVIIDGPPAATGKHARYPAGPLILQHFAGAHIDLLLDDYIRDDEREVAKLWQADVVAAKLSYAISERKLEKDACLMAVSNPKENA